MEKVYDVIIIGGGPAGMTSAIYSLRANKKVLLIEKYNIGGQVAITNNIKNYPGFLEINGYDLSMIMHKQCENLGLETIFTDVKKFDLTDKIKKVETYDGTFFGKTIILCVGASARALNLDNEKKYLGKGISYCATCDGNFFKDKIVAVVGGGNTAFDDCLYLLNLAKKVYLIHRRDAFRGESISAEKLIEISKEPNSKLELVLNSEVVKINGDNKLQSIEVFNKVTKETQTINLDGLFIAVGRKPDTELVSGLVELDNNGYIIANEKMETNIEGVYAAGDVVKKQLRQIVTACADGAIASVNSTDYIFKNFKKDEN